ncbi:MAG: YdcF family protein [Prevotella sp.]|nr:YdcF family protein [Prevotella sp.]
MKKMIKVFLIIFLCVLFIAITVIVTCNVAVLQACKGKKYDNASTVPHREVGLLLGTCPVGRTGNPNQFFLRRIDATVALWKAGKFDSLLISGGNFPNSYNEPEEMKARLVERGVPADIMTLDGKGFRTINSIEKTKELFEGKTVTIISQEFHNERALYLAKTNGVDAIAFNAGNTKSRKWKFRMKCREILARVKAVFETL